MGQGESRPEQHVFAADSPVRFSQAVIDGLQGSAETDSTRAQSLELKIQSRVQAELERIATHESSRLADLTSSLTTNPPSPSSPEPERSGLLAHLSSPFHQTADSGRSADSVSGEIAALRAKLDKRKKVDKMSPEVARAKERVVLCLKVNDRRPLDCWREVEEFRRQVGVLERRFVDQAGR